MYEIKLQIKLVIYSEPKKLIMKPIIPLISKCYQDLSWKDLEIVCNNEKILCHKFILATVSPLLHQLFTDSSIEEDKTVVILDKFYLSDIKKLVAFSYGLSKKIPTSIVSAFGLINNNPSKVNTSSTKVEKVKIDYPNTTLINQHSATDYFESNDNFEDANEEGVVKSESENKENVVVLNIKRNIIRRRKRALLERTCPYCSKVISGKKGAVRYNQHIYSKHRERYQEHVDNQPVHNRPTKVWPLPCEVCGKLIFSKKSYDQHKSSHEEKTTSEVKYTYKCPEDNCNEKFTSKEKFSRHLKNEHGLSKNEILVRGGTVPKPVENVQCNICGLTLRYKYGLADHMKALHSISNSPDHTCHQCGKVFKVKKLYLRHMEYHLPDNEKRYQCNICHKGFTTKNSYEGHMNSHLKLKPFTCKVCSQGFQNESNLRHHLKTVHKTTLKDVSGIQ